MRFEIIEKEYMDLIIVKDFLKYTGKEIEPLWAFKNFNVQKDNIVAFRGKIEVDQEHMKDLKDVKREQHIKTPIRSDDSINFIVEHFDMIDLKTTYLRQRLLICIAKEIIERECNKKLKRDGDDLYYNNKKLSVSIACKGITSSKIHLGINVKSKGVEHVEIIGLEDLGVENIKEVMIKIALSYIDEINKIEKDIRKTLPI
ncbi:protein of unknown function DUF366 [Methanocaldococcus vulcanius M7]|uniref:DUF366 domain-containing protein n=1 Tax=Methanocaldococcus vulcanius (strain ATCC 700851 / DSM 12094 / M7) TaxID=579137 RepID=C9RDJ4_METVM|nr:DUF366 family protein [Methanocaldococcus vulcanius]ACX73373.1 protein of unknown function DUF366 [Methanocaldococcus vulcanius M7]